MNEILSTLRRIQSDTTLKNYLVAKVIPVEIDEKLEDLNVKGAWNAHESTRNKFIKVRKAETIPSEIQGPSYLDLKIKITQEMLKDCIFCEGRCGANRLEGEKGYCLVPAAAHVSSAFLHHGEETPIVPSGTIFFSGCNFKCVYCQNDDISTSATRGQVASPNDLASMAKRLYNNGAKNINYVGGDPTPNLHVILESLRFQELLIAQLWNSNFYNSIEAINLLLDVMDIWLPDFKYGNNDCAKRLSGITAYWETLTRNLKHVHDEMVARRWASLIIRHLVLPDHVECCSIPILDWIGNNLPNAMVNIMGQYRPHHMVRRHPEKYKEITRRPSREEMMRVRAYADSININYKPVS